MMVMRRLKILVGACQHTDEVSGTNRPDHHEDEEAIEPLAFIEPANVLVVGLLTDHGLDEQAHILARWKIMAQPITIPV